MPAIRIIFWQSNFDKCFIWLKILVLIFAYPRYVLLVLATIFLPITNAVLRARTLDPFKQSLVFNDYFDNFFFSLIVVQTMFILSKWWNSWSLRLTKRRRSMCLALLLLARYPSSCQARYTSTLPFQNIFYLCENDVIFPSDFVIPLMLQCLFLLFVDEKPKLRRQRVVDHLFHSSNLYLMHERIPFVFSHETYFILHRNLSIHCYVFCDDLNWFCLFLSRFFVYFLKK